MDHGTQAPGRGDRLQTGDAGAHDQDLGRIDAPGRGHQHGVGAAVFAGRIEHQIRYQPGYTLMGGTSEVQRNLIATRGLGLPR